jgi:hypothetical protein
MRISAFLLASSAAILAPAVVFAQVSDTERAAARDLFKQGDEFQRAGKFAEALDKFQRAQQVYAAPTNQLRIAECQAALGHLVESAEAYRAVVRTQLPPGSPPAFQTAIDQAKAELEQVEPRVPRVVIQVQGESPTRAPLPTPTGAQLQIDGQNVSGALIGEPIPLDPGLHRVAAIAPGFASAEQAVTLHERETRTLAFSLKAQPGAPPPQPLPPAANPPTARPAPPAVSPTAPAPTTAAPPVVVYTPPAPPPPPPPPKVSHVGLLFGGHLGLAVPSGQLPLGAGDSADISNYSLAGVSYGLDFGFRFARRLVLNVIVEGESYSAGSKDTKPSSGATLFGATFGFMGNPDRTSFYGEIGAAERWYWYNDPNDQFGRTTGKYRGGEFILGLGCWIPIGRAFRLLPKVTLGVGPFDQPDNSGSAPLWHDMLMFGLAGFYSLNFY